MARAHTTHQSNNGGFTSGANGAHKKATAAACTSRSKPSSEDRPAWFLRQQRGFTSGAHSALKEVTAEAVTSGSKAAWFLRQQDGFTLAEVIVVISLIAVLGGFSLLVSMDSYAQYLFQNDRDMLVTTLHRARAQALANVCLDNSAGDYCDEGRGKAHGVAIRPGGDFEYVIFQTDEYDDDYADRDEDIDISFASSQAVDVDADADYFIFSQLSGNVATEGTITLTDGVRESVITIGEEGQISWTH